MAWYRTGTVAVTNGSTTVTGTGTAWVANAIAGQGIVLPDGRTYEILAIVSNTQITIGSAYLGSTSSGQNYVILPTRGPEQTQAQLIAAMVASYGAAFTGAGQGKFAAGSVAAPSLRNAADENTGINFLGSDQFEAVTNGIRRWLLSNTAMQIDVPVTGLAVVQSTTDVTAGRLLTTGAGAAQAFRRGNILGVVSQAAGVPTGSVIERGSNANGEFVRFADGTQICTAGVISSSSAAVPWTYPAAFVTTPSVAASPAGSASLQVTRTTRSATSVGWNCWNLEGAREVVAMDVTAIGRWF